MRIENLKYNTPATLEGYTHVSIDQLVGVPFKLGVLEAYESKVWNDEAKAYETDADGNIKTKPGYYVGISTDEGTKLYFITKSVSNIRILDKIIASDEVFRSLGVLTIGTEKFSGKVFYVIDDYDAE